MQAIYCLIITVTINKSIAGIASPFPISRETQSHLHPELLVALQEESISTQELQSQNVQLKIPQILQYKNPGKHVHMKIE